MCGGFTLRLNPDRFLKVKEPGRYGAFKPIYNARPGELLPIVTEEHPQQLTLAIWDFVPQWATHGKARGVINARAESLIEKPYFRSAVTKRRCLIPADGFYEWESVGSVKKPHFFHVRDDKPFAFAGVYDERPGQDGVLGFAIITTVPNELVGRIHTRMPVMLTDTLQDVWLSSDTPVSDVMTMLQPFDASLMETYPVSVKVNSARYKGSDVLEKADGG